MVNSIYNKILYLPGMLDLTPKGHSQIAMVVGGFFLVIDVFLI